MRIFETKKNKYWVYGIFSGRAGELTNFFQLVIIKERTAFQYDNSIDFLNQLQFGFIVHFLKLVLSLT